MKGYSWQKASLQLVAKKRKPHIPYFTVIFLFSYAHGHAVQARLECQGISSLDGKKGILPLQQAHESMISGTLSFRSSP